MSKKYYEKLYTEAEKNYDTIIIDMPSTPFLDVVPFSLMQADKILFVLNPNFISIRQAIKYIDLMVNVWQIDKEKIFLIINKTTENSLTLKQVKAMLRDYTVLLKLEETRNVEKIVNGLANITGEEIIDTDELTKMLNIDDCVQRVKGEEKTSAYKCIQNCFGRKENKKDTK